MSGPERQGSVPRAPQFTMVFGALGAASMAFTNALRARPVLYRAWLPSSPPAKAAERAGFFIYI